MLSDLIDKVYEGSATSLVMQALSSRKSTPEELAQIKQLISDRIGTTVTLEAQLHLRR